MTHNFKETTFGKPTYCDYCTKFLWGIVKQGSTCIHCKMNVHHKCSTELETACVGVVVSDVRSRSASFSSQSNLEVPDVDHFHSDQEGAAKPKRRSPSTVSQHSLVQELAANTAVAAKEIKKNSKEPPLSFTTTMPKNLTRFVMRITPLVNLQEQIIEILSWNNPSKSLIVLLSYILLCLLPSLFLVLPQIGFIYYVIQLYYERTTKKMHGRKLSLNNQYLKNFRFIQNHMGKFADLYDHIKSQKKYIDWSDEQETLRILKYTTFSMFIVIVAVRFIPLNLIMLVGGIAVFFQNTAFIKAASITLPPVVMENINHQVQKWTLSFSSSNTFASGIVTVNLMENQRWWAGLGWIPHLLRAERGPWTNEDGDINRPPKEEYELPNKDWEWIDSDWHMDMSWAAQLDESGWVYTDHSWKKPSGHPGMSLVTRRRKWIRRMKMVSKQKTL